MNDQSVEIEEKKYYSWNDNIRTVLVALALAVLFRSFLFEPFHIPSGSMKSNLLVGDYLFVSKYAYGYSRYSFPLGLPFFHGRVLENLPKRGDVVVFRPPGSPGVDFIKRVMGLPGDHIQVKEGVVYINGTALPRQQVDTYTDDEIPDRVKTIPRFSETLPEGKTIMILQERETGSVDNTPIYTVPEGHYFMMGDNRDNSADSRVASGVVGFVPEENLVGKAEIIFFSTDGSAQWLNPVSWIKAIRANRFFRPIE